MLVDVVAQDQRRPLASGRPVDPVLERDDPVAAPQRVLEQPPVLVPAGARERPGEPARAGRRLRSLATARGRRLHWLPMVRRTPATEARPCEHGHDPATSARLRRELRVRDAERLALRAGSPSCAPTSSASAASRAWRWGHARPRWPPARCAGRPAPRAPSRARSSGSTGSSACSAAPQPATAARAAELRVVLHQARRPRAARPRTSAATSTSPRRSRASSSGAGTARASQVLPEEEAARRRPRTSWSCCAGAPRHTPRAAQLNVLWVISHPAERHRRGVRRLRPRRASRRSAFAAALRARTSTPVIVLEQATDPERLPPRPGAAGHDARARVRRQLPRRRGARSLDDLLPTSHELAVYGGGWDGLIDPRHLVARARAQRRAAARLLVAAIVLNDHWDGHARARVHLQPASTTPSPAARS